MTVTLKPGRLTGKLAAMPSKSDLHRLMIAMHLAGMDIDALPVISDDIAATKACLQSDGICNCRESGSTLRFLLPVMAALGKNVTFTGEGRLPARPMQPLVDLLRGHGCDIDNDRLPIAISGQLLPGQFTLPGDVSSQYITGLLFALPLLSGDSEIMLASPLESLGYVNMTLRTLKTFSIEIAKTANSYHVSGNQKYLPPAVSPLTAEADWSNAAFWLAANALGSGIHVTHLDENSAQPDRATVPLLKNCGEMDASQCPDLVPVMAVVMALTPGEHRIINAARLRLKESDRLHAMAQNLCSLGADAEELPDGLVIRGKLFLQGGEVNGFGDHRIAMAMAIAALRCEQGVTLHGAEAVRKSYPKFWEDYQRLGGQLS